MIKIVNAKPKQDAPREAQPDSPEFHAAQPAPSIHVAPLLANQIKEDNDGKSVCIGGRGHLLEFSCVNLSAGTRYLQVFNSDTIPSDGARPKRVWTITTGAGFDGIWPSGRPFGSGCCLVLSSTQSSLTVVTAKEAIIEASFLIQ